MSEKIKRYSSIGQVFDGQKWIELDADMCIDKDVIALASELEKVKAERDRAVELLRRSDTTDNFGRVSFVRDRIRFLSSLNNEEEEK